MRYRFQFRRYRLPFRTAVRTAHGVWSEREGVVVRLEPHEEQGAGSKEQEGHSAAGYGEAAPVPGFSRETVNEIEAACREIGEWVEEGRLRAAARGWPCLGNALGAAVAAAKGFDPLSPGESETHGGENPARRLVDKAPYLGIAALLPAGKAALAQIEPKAEIGFRVFKWKVGVGDIADELTLLDDVCARLPNGAQLRPDANGAWDRRKAERWLERCAERPVEFVEQPCFAEPSAFATATAGTSSAAARKEMDLLLGLARDFPTKIALDESLVGDGDVEKWIGAGWPGIFVVKPSLFGDAVATMARLEKARADVVFSSALETAVGAKNALRGAFDWAAKREAENHRWAQMNADAETQKAVEAGGAKVDLPPPLPVRALGFGVYPLFQDARFNGPMAMPFVRWEDVDRINAEAVWNALG